MDLRQIVGVADIVDVVTDSASEWALPHRFHWVLANPRVIEPISYKGALGLQWLDHQIDFLIEQQLSERATALRRQCSTRRP